ncbi:hypothetical protein BT93_F0569 [Corymbia citriodora subsp. variegata]|nr:hypothetical protein BT93_F0569 [Corymbia citriodora subsp. variegata]
MSSPMSRRPYSVRVLVSGFFHTNDHHQVQQPGHVSWSSKIYHCSGDPRSCWTTFFCPCVTFGRIAAYAEEGSSSCMEKGALYCLAAALTGGLGACCCGCYNRAKMRTGFDWEQKRCADCSVHCLCHCCALCQEYRHLQSLGCDTSKGWEENSQMRNGSIEMTPPPTMTNFQT